MTFDPPTNKVCFFQYGTLTCPVTRIVNDPFLSITKIHIHSTHAINMHVSFVIETKKKLRTGLWFFLIHFLAQMFHTFPLITVFYFECSSITEHCSTSEKYSESLAKPLADILKYYAPISLPTLPFPSPFILQNGQLALGEDSIGPVDECVL